MVGEVAMRRGDSEGARRTLGFCFCLQQIHSSPLHCSISTSPLLRLLTPLHPLGS
jgi:hypothetical protein